MLEIKGRSLHEPKAEVSITSNEMVFLQGEIVTALAMRAGRVVKFADPEGGKFQIEEFVLLRRGAPTAGSKSSRGCGLAPRGDR